MQHDTIDNREAQLADAVPEEITICDILSPSNNLDQTANMKSQPIPSSLRSHFVTLNVGLFNNQSP